MQFGQAKDWAIFADIFGANITAAAFSDAALHAFLERGVDGIGFEAQVFEDGQSKFGHDRGATNNGNGILRVRANGSYGIGHKTHQIRPIWLWVIYGLEQVDLMIFMPALQTFFVEDMA